MIKKLILALAFMVPGFSYAGASAEVFFQSLVGKWHGEVPGYYVADITFNAVDVKKAWQIQMGIVDITEGGEKFNYEFELSKNENAIDNKPVYFLKMNNLITKESEIFTLTSHEAKANATSFWRHFAIQRNETEYISANAVKLFLDKGVLTWGFASGNGYCKDSAGSADCASGGYTPYELKKIN